MEKIQVFNKSIIAVLVLLFIFAGCSKQEDLIEELEVSREFAPVGLRAIVRNQVIVELNWTTKESVSKYVVEFSEADSTFNNIVRTVEVAPNQLPIQERFDGETKYFIRVKAISADGLDDSSWAVTSAETLAEQLFLPQENGDILATEATLRWVPNSEVTQIDLNSGSIIYDISDQEKIAGVATITGLTGETDYSAVLLNGTKIRGTASFTTGIDVSSGTIVTPSDDLLQRIMDALPGDILLLEPGDYTLQTGTVDLNKPLTIRGLQSFDKPLVSLSINLVAGATDVELIDLDFDGNGVGGFTNFVRYEEAGDYNSLLISGCNVHDYTRSFISGNTTDANIQSITVENCVVTDILTDGGDFIDFRNSNVLNMTVTTSTFNNCAPGRDFFRLDAAGSLSGTGQTCNVLLENCTLYQCSNNDSRRILYIRFELNEIEVRNNLITDTVVEGFSDRDGTDENIIFRDNNYFNAPTLFDDTVLRYDNSGTHTTLDPGFVDPSMGDFTVTNQDLKDRQVGDPRWW